MISLPFLACLALLPTALASLWTSPQHVIAPLPAANLFAESSATDANISDRQTMEEAVESARAMLHLIPTGVMGTTFPSTQDDELADMPFALMEYSSPHPEVPSSLLFILMPISRTTQNIIASRGHRASYTVTNKDGRVNQERVSLLGNFTLHARDELPSSTDALYSEQYLKYHPDAKWWLPSFPGSPHASFWATFTPSKAFYVGGFGDTHYIGWLDMEEWRK